MNWLILGYFVVLMAERAISLVKSVGDNEVSLFGNGFNRYVYGILILSLAATVVLLATINRDFMAALFTGGTVDYKKLCITMGVLLMSGMVHTEHTIAPVQFGAYGLLIVALVIQTVKNMATADSKVMLWMSLVYLILFSMAIPVMYKSEISSHVLFHVLEAIVAAALVVMFTYMMWLIFAGAAVNLFLIIPIVVAVVGDAILIFMRWQEKVNGFVLIFVIASLAMWVIGKVLSLILLK